MADGVRVGEGYIEVRPELDEAALVAKRAELERAMARSYDNINRDYIKQMQARIQSESSFQKVANNSTLQAAVALEKQRQAALAAGERDRTKATTAAESERQSVLKRFEVDAANRLRTNSAAALAQAKKTAQLEADLKKAAIRADTAATKVGAEARTKIIQDATDKQRKAQTRASAGNNGIFGALGGPQIVNVLQGVGIAGLVGTITPATGAVLALASSFAIAGTGVATFGLAAAGHISQVSAVLKQVNDQGRSLSSLPVEFQRLIPAINDFRATYQGFLSVTRGPVFDTFERGLDLAKVGLTEFAPVVNATAGGISKAIDIFKEFAQGPSVARFLAVVQSQAPGAIQSLTRSVVNLGSGLLDLFTGFAPAGQTMLQTIERLTQRFAAWSAQLQGSGAFQQFTAYVQQYAPKVVEIITNIVVVVGKLIVGLAPIAAVFTVALEAATRFLAAVSPQVWTGIIVAVAGFWVVWKGFSIISATMVSLKELAASFPAFAAAMGVAEGGAITLRVALTALTTATVVGLAITAVVAIISSLAGANDSAAAATSAHKDAVRDLASALRDADEAARNNKYIDLLQGKTKPQYGPDTTVLEQASLAGIPGRQVVAGLAGDRAAYDLSYRQFEDYARKLADAASRESDPKKHDALLQQAVAADAAGQHYKELASQVADAASANQQWLAAGGQVPGALNAQGSAADLAATLFDRYTKAKQAALGLGTPEGQVTDDLSRAFAGLQQSLRSVADARYNEGQAAKQAADANVQAARQVVDARYALTQATRQVTDAQYAETQAQAATRQAVLDLSAARDEAARKLRDQPGVEEGAKIALERAQADAAALGLYHGAVVAPDVIAKQEATLRLTEAQNALKDATAAGDIIRKQGIEDQPAVLAAKKSLADAIRAETQARQAVKDALHGEAQARQAVADATKNQTDTLLNGQHAKAAAHQATLDAITAERVAQAAYDASTTAIEGAAGAAGIATTAMQGLRGEFNKAFTADTGNVQSQLADVSRYIQAIKLLAANPSMDFATAWAQAGVPTAPGIADSAHARAVQHALEGKQNYAIGGPITGPGTGTSDSILASGPGGYYGLSNNEHIVTAAEVAAAGGHGNVMAIRKAMLRGRFAEGGPVMDLSKMSPGKTLVEGGILARALTANGLFPTGTGTNLPALLGFGGGKYGHPFAADYSGADPTGAISMILGLARSFDPSAQVSSGFRPGDPGYHGQGLAADLIGDMAAIAKGFYGLAPSLLEEIHSPSWFVKNGQKVGSGIYRAVYDQHFNHVHVAATVDALRRLTSTGPILGGLPGAVGSWIAQASKYTNIPGSWVPGLETLIQRESGGNPASINLTDSNAAAGHPSIGLMQIIKGTFEQYRSKLLPDSQYDPVANIVAGVNYIRARYGDISHVQQADPNAAPRGYKNGGVMMPGDLGINETREPEFVFNKTQLQQLGGRTDVHIHLDDDRLKGLIRVEIESNDNDLATSLRGGHGRKG